MTTQIHHSYPTFEKNQVLTHSQLNQLAAYLEEQGRMTRSRLIGMGIVCGLNLRHSGSAALEISKGLGITSRGYLLSLAECSITKKRAYFINEYTDYPPFQDPDSGEQDISLLELLSDKYSGDEEGVEPLNQSDLQDSVVLLFLEIFDKNLKSCLSKGCDEIGVERKLNVRKLLISKSDLNKVKGRTGGGETEELAEGREELPPVKIKRLLLRPDSPTSGSYQEMASAYVEEVRNQWETLQRALSRSYEIYQPILRDLYDENPFETEAVRRSIEMVNDYMATQSGSSAPEPGVQYLYGFIKDLIMAYEEFRLTGYELNGICSPDAGRYPRHLMLGAALEEETGLCGSGEFRHEFAPSPVISDRKQWSRRLKMLHKRIVLLLEKVELGHKRDLKITPSREKMGPLSERTIPVYYRSKEQSEIKGLGSLEACWNFDLQRQCLPGDKSRQISYDNHQPEADESPVQTPLLFDLDSYNFLRIEGHIGTGPAEAQRLIQQIRHEHNLGFDLKTLYFTAPGTASALPDCLIEDLQPQYAIWRNRMLLFVKNLVKTSATAERVIKRGLKRGDTASGRFSGEFEPASILDTGLSDLRNLFTRDKPQEFARSSERMFTFMRTLEEASRAEESGGEADGDEPIRKQFALLNDCLHGLMASLPVSIRDFSMNKWLDQYKCTLRVLVDLMKMQAEKVSNALTQLIALILLYILSAIHSFLMVLAIYPYIPIGVLMQTLETRMSAWLESMQLSRYLNDHPGLEHKAGVAPGETFFLICQSEPGDEDREPESRIVADFTAPFVCCGDCGKPTVDENEIKPFAAPVTAVIMTQQSESERFDYQPAELQLINNLYDPGLYTPEGLGEPEFGAYTFRDVVYEPDPSRKKSVLVYTVDRKAVDHAAENTDKLFLIDEFDYVINDARSGEPVDKNTITIFIPLLQNIEPEPGTVKGRIRADNPEGVIEPLAGANVTVEGQTIGTAADMDGNYTLRNIPAGPQVLVASFIGYGQEKKEVTVASGEQVVNFTMHPFIIDVKYDVLLESMDLDRQSREARDLIEHHNQFFAEANQKIMELAGNEEDDPTLKKTASAVREFTHSGDMNVVRLNNEYDKLKDELVKDIKGSEEEERKKYESAFETLTEVYLDRIAIMQPKAFSTTTKKVVDKVAKLAKDEPALKLDDAVSGWQERSTGFLSSDFSRNLSNVFRRR